MPNDDDLGQFPTPSDTATLPVPPVDPQNIPNLTSDTTPPTFEETPDEIPSSITVPATPPPPAPVAATVPTPKGGSAFGSLIAIVLLLISGVAMAVTVFLFSQSQQLKRQLSEVTKTLEQQRTTITPSPTPTIIEFPTPTPTQEATESAIIIPTPTATPSAINVATPLAGAAKALMVAINHLPNAQMIIIKTENATSPTQSATKYFFRQDLTTKKYFYILVTNKNEPEVVDKAIYVTPDNNIPSLNDSIQANTLGIDLDEAIKVASAICTSKLCDTAGVKAQYIRSTEMAIWQLTFTPLDPNKSPLIIQINAKTKEILYKSPGF